MNQSGVKTRKGNKWSKDTVTDFLQNEFFYGKVAYRDELWPGRQQAIITKELFDQREGSACKTRPSTAFPSGFQQTSQGKFVAQDRLLQSM